MLNNNWSKLTPKIEISNPKLEYEKWHPAYVKNIIAGFVCKLIMASIEAYYVLNKAHYA